MIQNNSPNQMLLEERKSPFRAIFFWFDYETNHPNGLGKMKIKYIPACFLVSFQALWCFGPITTLSMFGWNGIKYPLSAGIKKKYIHIKPRDLPSWTAMFLVLSCNLFKDLWAGITPRGPISIYTLMCVRISVTDDRIVKSSIAVQDVRPLP